MNVGSLALRTLLNTCVMSKACLLSFYLFLRSMLWCKTDGQKEDREPNGDVGIEGNSGSDGKGEWTEMVWVCVGEG